MPSGRGMFAVRKYIADRARALVEDYSRVKVEPLLPIDLHEIARLTNIRSIEEREMIPEAVLEVAKNEFRVFLQSNFVALPGTRIRQRFSLAHEIAHTFFYDGSSESPKPLREAPTGDKLEVACHEAASLILLPGPLLKVEIERLNDFPTVEQLCDLADTFDVSMEVLLRRLQGLKIFDTIEPARAPILVHGADERIEYAVFPQWLSPMLPVPQRGTEFASWFRKPAREAFTIGSAEVDSRISRDGVVLSIRTRQGDVAARRFKYSSSSSLYEITVRWFGSTGPIGDEERVRLEESSARQ